MADGETKVGSCFRQHLNEVEGRTDMLEEELAVLREDTTSFQELIENQSVQLEDLNDSLKHKQEQV